MEGYAPVSYADFETAEQNNALLVNTVLRDGADFPETDMPIESLEGHPQRERIIELLDIQAQQIVDQVEDVLGQRLPSEQRDLEELPIPTFNFPEDDPVMKSADHSEHEDPLRIISEFWETLEVVNDADGAKKARRLAS